MQIIHAGVQRYPNGTCQNMGKYILLIIIVFVEFDNDKNHLIIQDLLANTHTYLFTHVLHICT